MSAAQGYEVKIIRSRRRTLSARIKGETLVVEVPYGTSDQEINEFLNKHRRWIHNHLEKARASAQEAEAEGKLTMEEIQMLADQALKYIPDRVRYYASKMGVTYGRITIRNQKTRWGSCSSKGNLNFNCLLMLCPREVIDSVVVHELAHRIEMNHSGRFYDIVLHAFPDYWTCDRWLKENGPVLLKRMIM